MDLYYRKILNLEDDFALAKDELRNLLDKLKSDVDNQKPSKDDDQKPSKDEIKMTVDLVNGLIKVAKEQAGYYIMLREKYDLMKFLNELVDFLKVRDHELASEIMLLIDKKWRNGETDALDN